MNGEATVHPTVLLVLLVLLVLRASFFMFFQIRYKNSLFHAHGKINPAVSSTNLGSRLPEACVCPHRGYMKNRLYSCSKLGVNTPLPIPSSIS